MRLLDCPEDKIVVGMKVRSLVDANKIGRIDYIDPTDDDYAVIQWLGTEDVSGFYGNDCECEVVSVPCRVCDKDCEGPIEDAVEYQVCFECVKGIVAC